MKLIKIYDKQTTSKRQANDKQTTTTKEYKEPKEPKEPKEKKPSASRSVSDKKSDTDFVDKVVNQFASAHGDYEVLAPGKERAAAGRLLAIYRSKYPDANSQDAIQGLRDYFDQCVKINDDWYRKNMSLSLIVSKFNEINKILKNGTTGKGKSQGVSDDFRKWVFDGLCTAESGEAVHGN